MSLDVNLQEVIEIAFIANPSNAEYFLRKHLATLRKSLSIIKAEMDHVESEIMDQSDFNSSSLLSGKLDHLENLTEDMEKTIYDIESLISSLNCKL